MNGYFVFIGIFVFFLVIVVFMPFEQFVRRKNFKQLIQKIQDEEKAPPTLSAAGIFEKVIRYASKFYGLIKGRIKPKNYEKYSRYVVLAGLSERITVEGLITSKFFLAILGGAYILVFGLLNNSLIMLTPVFLFIGFMLPDVFVKNQIKVRKFKIEKDLPSVLNTMAIMSEAGLGLFESIEKVCEVRKGLFVNELKKVNEEVNMGVLRKEAFLQMADRCEVPELSTFVSALVQVMEKGAAGISIFIKEQAIELWEKRLNKAKEHGAKASLKLFFPMMFLVMPASMIFLLGPIVVNIIRGS
jgi:tight adherence protein C